MQDFPPTGTLHTRRRVLRALLILRAAVVHTEQALSHLAGPDAEHARRSWPVTTLADAIDAWCVDLASAFDVTGPPAPAGSDSHPRVLRFSANAAMTYAALLEAFSHAPTDESLLCLIAAYRAMDVLDERPPMPAREQLDVVAGQLDLLRGALGAVADGLRAMPGAALLGALLPHPALTARGSPFGLDAFSPSPELAALAQRECAVCQRPTPPVEDLPVCQVMLLERHGAAPDSETGIAAGFLSLDGWIFSDAASATVFAATCPDHVDIGADVRPFDAAYFDAYLEHFGHAAGPFASSVRCRRMVEVLRRDPFAPPS